MYLDFLSRNIMEKRRIKYIENANLAPMDKKIRIIKLAYKREILSRERAAVPRIIDQIVEVLEEVHKGSWDIVFKRGIQQYSQTQIKDTLRWIGVDIVIHYPLINITNSKGLKHLIRDMYVSLDFGGISVKGFKAKRMSATRKEISSKYQHSHLPGRHYLFDRKADSDSPLRFRRFCLGQSEINQVLTILSGNFKPEIFKLFLFQLQEYLNWESLEGGPHHHISNIGGTKLDNLSDNMVKNYDKSLMEAREDVKKDLNFTLVRDQIKVVDNHKLEDYIKTYGEDRSSYNSSLIGVKDEMGDYYSMYVPPREFPERLLAPPSDLKKADFLFRGELVTFKIIEEEGQFDEKPFFVHKKIKEHVKTRIEETIKTQRFGSYISKQLNPTRDRAKNDGQNRVPVPQ